MKNLETMKENTKYQINNIDGFLEFIRLANSRGYRWYRGQRDDSWDIESSVSRNKKRVPSNSISSIKYKITNFAEGIEEIREVVKSVQEYESIKDLNLNSLQFGLLAQHYGYKTPFIDWTEDPNIALFFSLEGFLSYYDKVNEKYTRPILYATNPNLLNYCAGLSIHGFDTANVVSAEDKATRYYYERQIALLNPKSDASNAFVYPVAVETNLDFCHRITRQSGKFTIKGPKNPSESNNFRDQVANLSLPNSSQLFMSATLNFDKNRFHAELRRYLNDFHYTKESVYRIGDQNSKLVEDLFARFSTLEQIKEFLD